MRRAAGRMRQDRPGPALLPTTCDGITPGIRVAATAGLARAGQRLLGDLGGLPVQGFDQELLHDAAAQGDSGPAGGKDEPLSPLV